MSKKTEMEVAAVATEPSTSSTSLATYMPELLKLAVEKGGDGVTALERLVALQERVMARDAAHEFAEAMAAFQETCPPVRKTSTAKVTTKSGGQYAYAYAELDEIARTVRPHLHKHGLSYSWDCEVTAEGARITVICSLQHVNGHKAQAKFEAPTASLSGAMSKQQEVAAALTFGKRQTLIQVLGLTTCDPDTDAAANEPVEYLTPIQVDTLEALLDQRPEGSRWRLLTYLGVGAMEEIPASRYQWLVDDLTTKIKGQK